jgi:twitching motility two-component system response regulator PilH
MKKILVVEDDHKIRELLLLCLRSAGYEVKEARNGQEGYEAATGELFDIVVTDGLMPKMHGFELCNKLKTDKYRGKVIILTAVYKARRYRMEVAADAYLTKPFDPDELLKTISELLESEVTE